MSSQNRLIVAVVVVVVAAVAFWTLALSPKREEAGTLSEQASALHASLAESQSNLAEAAASKREFPTDYQQLVVLGKAVPHSDETSSLLVELNQIARSSKVKFNSIHLSAAGSEGESPPAAVTTPAPEAGATGAISAAATIPPTEVAASLLPLGATVGSAGLAVMPYELTFTGSFFHVADFIGGIDSLVHTGKDVSVDGRLVTVNGFALNEESNRGFPQLNATFSVNTYLVPPGQGVTAGATAAAPSATTTSASETSTTSSTPESGAQ